MTFISIVKLQGNFIDTHIAMQQSCFYQPYLIIGNILLQRFSALLFKISAQIT